jgi:hypothetical protein
MTLLPFILPAPRPSTNAASTPGTLIAVSEAHNVCVYDLRQGAKGPPAMRFASTAGYACHALAAAPSGAGYPLLGVSGTERALVVYDCRAGRPLRRQNGIMRKAVLSLAFSTLDSRWIYAAGADNEILCRRWDVLASPVVDRETGEDDNAGGGGKGGDGGARATEWACRGDARWMGLAVAPHGPSGGEVLAGWSPSSVTAACVQRT